MPEGRSSRLQARLILLAWLALGTAWTGAAQVIEFYSGSLRYLAQTRNGLTVMFAELPLQVRGYAVLQIAVINGTDEMQTAQPVDFSFQFRDGRVVKATGESQFVSELYHRGGRSDVIKLVTTYEKALYGAEQIRSNNGYEQRRQAALAMGAPSGVKAAAAASAIVLVRTRLKPKDSTDGAVFFPNSGKALGPGTLRAQIGEEVFELQAAE
jgi:hypothetical protein